MKMNNLFDKLFEVSDTADSLDKFLNENMQTVNEFYNSNYACILLSKNSIEKFILLKNTIITQLDFSKSYAKSFVLILLDFCERFNFIARHHEFVQFLPNTIYLLTAAYKRLCNFCIPDLKLIQNLSIGSI